MIRKHIFGGMMLAVPTMLILWSATRYQFGGLENAIRYIQGYDYVVSPKTIDIGMGRRGDTRTALITVRNLSFTPIHVVGAITTCNCVAVTGLPLYIEPRQSLVVKLVVYLESNSTKVQQMAIILIEDGHLQRAPVVITGKVSEA